MREERKSLGSRWRRREIEELAEALSILQGGWRADGISPYFNTFRFVSKPVALSQNITQASVAEEQRGQ